MFRVCYHNNGGTLFIQVSEELHYFVTIGGVKVTCRFIRKDELGIVNYRAGYGYTLLLTT